MVDTLEFLQELKELQALYHSGDLRDFDFNTKIQKYEREVAKFEEYVEEQHKLFFKSTPLYQPVKEV